MKEAIRKIICSIMPFLVESLYVKDRYDLKKIPVFFKAILLFLPSAFLYVVSNYKQSDKRKIKYWLPYGPMRNFEKKAYGSNLEKKKRFFIIRFIRYWLPYGYVLWWDNESQLSKKPAAPAAKPAAPAAATQTIMLRFLLQFELKTRKPEFSKQNSLKSWKLAC